jgi:DNA-directed RNA polymerase specialized sigma24 family protein
MTQVDLDFARTQAGDLEGFTAWVRAVEAPLRARLASFAPHVDVECVVQEALLRMWRLAPTLTLTGADASLRYASRLARNLALNEARRFKPGFREADLDEGPEPASYDAPPPDAGLRRQIAECLARRKGKPKLALLARLVSGGADPDGALAARLAMTRNTFLQNVVRARSRIAACLASKGSVLEELLR